MSLDCGGVADDDRLRVTYLLSGVTGGDAGERARAIALEQTVELPAACLSAEIAGRIVGVVESVKQLGDGRAKVVVSYDPVVVGGDASQLFNVLFGNVSLQRGVLVARVDWPASLLERLRGPRHGIEGLRRRCGVTDARPLLCGALKPMGLDAEGLAGLAYQLALGGADVVKDDHGLADQDPAPFAERVRACQAAVDRANERGGGSTVYAPNVVGGGAAIGDRLRLAHAAGCRGVLVSPLLVGADTVRWIADAFDFVVLAHPALSGAYFGPDHGIAPDLLLGRLFRLIGADGVIYPNAGGRFPLDETVCEAINAAARSPLGQVRPAMPMPGGGIDVARMPEWVGRYGADTMFLIGGSLFLQPDLVEAVRALRATLRDG